MLYDFILDKCVTSDSRNKKQNGESVLIPAQIRPFGKWYENKFGSLLTNYIVYAGIFAVAKEDILKQPVSYYQQFLDELSVGSNPEVGHYVERSWQAIFNPPSNRIYIEGFNDDRLEETLKPKLGCIELPSAYPLESTGGAVGRAAGIYVYFFF